MTDTQQPVRSEQPGGTPDQLPIDAVAPPAKTLRGQGLSGPHNLVPEEHSSNANVENGIVGDKSQKNESQKTDRFDPDFTQNVINATGPKASPRIRKVMGNLIQHIHDFARENEITVDEWMAGVEMV